MMGFLTGGLAFGLVLLLVAVLACARIREQRKLLDTFKKLKLSHESLANKITTLENMVSEFARERQDAPGHPGRATLSLDTHVQDLLRIRLKDLFSERPHEVDETLRSLVNLWLAVDRWGCLEFSNYLVSAMYPSARQEPCGILAERDLWTEKVQWPREEDIWEPAAVR